MPEPTNEDPTPAHTNSGITPTTSSTSAETDSTSSPPFEYKTLGLVLWQLEPAYTSYPISPLILSKFSFLHSCLNDFHAHAWPMRTFAVTNHPGMLITMGPWESPAQHYEVFERSESIHEVLVALGGFADVRGSFHVDVRWEDVGRVWEKGGRSLMGRWWVRKEGRERFVREGWEGCKVRWEETGEGVVAGWRVPGWGWELGLSREERDDVGDDGDGDSGDGDDREDGDEGMVEWWSLGTLPGDPSTSTAAGQIPGDWDEMKHALEMCEKSDLWQLEMLDVKPLDESAGDDDGDEDNDE